MKDRLVLLAIVTALFSTGALAQQAPSPTAAAPVSDADLKAGKAVFDQWCATCHSEGRYMAGTNGLRAKYKETRPALLEERTDLTAEQVKFFVRRGVGIMAPFRKTEVTDAQLDLLARYLARNRRPS